MSNIIYLFPETNMDIPVDRVLDGAKSLKKVIVIGIDQNGDEYFASSCADIYECNFLADRFKKMLISELND